MELGSWIWESCGNCESIIFYRLNVGKVVGNMTQGSCILINFVKSSDDYFSLVHSIETEACIDSDKTNPAH